MDSAEPRIRGAVIASRVEGSPGCINAPTWLKFLVRELPVFRFPDTRLL